MAETTKTFTTEERIAFEEKYNLGVYNHESLIELLMRQEKTLEICHYRIDELQSAQEELEKCHNSSINEKYNPMIDLLKRMDTLEKSIIQYRSKCN